MIRHNGHLYARHQTLELNVRDPSPAMLAWIAVDLSWLADRDDLSLSGASLFDAVEYADAEAKRAMHRRKD